MIASYFSYVVTGSFIGGESRKKTFYNGMTLSPVNIIKMK
jgi:hypothetical protein